jgi:membrane associated rhomboid family serine protease
MIPLSDETPTLRRPVMTYLILAALFAVWIFVQGAGFDPTVLAASVCNLGMVPGEITHRAPLGYTIPIAPGMGCSIDNQSINIFTPLTSMFLHGSWGHILGNSIFLWVFGQSVEDGMGRMRFLLFYLICGLAAAAAHILVDPASPVPTVGASGAISGVLGAYLVLYPRVRVKMLFIWIIFIQVLRVPAWAVLLWWFVVQVLTGLPELTQVRPDVSSGIAVWAHVGGFITGMLLVRIFADPGRLAQRTMLVRARTAWG